VQGAQVPLGVQREIPKILVAPLGPNHTWRQYHEDFFDELVLKSVRRMSLLFILNPYFVLMVNF
jgi:hypothetical protein